MEALGARGADRPLPPFVHSMRMTTFVGDSPASVKALQVFLMTALERIWEILGLIFGGMLSSVERGITAILGPVTLGKSTVFVNALKKSML